LPTLDIDGRGQSIQEAVRDLWKRVKPLQDKGYHPVTSVEIVETKTKKVVETYQMTDREFIAHIEADEPKVAAKPRPSEHKTPRPHEFAYLARLRLES
jgi:hypothetical protein